jgi:hypothetical protein
MSLALKYYIPYIEITLNILMLSVFTVSSLPSNIL